jgi:hypothetical protein
MADCTSIETRLAAARAAYDDLMTGGAITRFVDQNGEAVQYSRANPQGLLAYITRLENELAVCQGQRSAYRGPLKFTFGRRCF